jgi:uncharacterized protein
MLTREHGIVVYEGGRAIPDRLTRRRHAHYLEYASRMLALYREGTGRTRRDLHQSVERLFDDEPDCDPRRVHAFEKLLDSASDYASEESATASDLRRQVFRMAAEFHPLVRQVVGLLEHDERVIKEGIAEHLGRPWPEIEADLYADVPDFHRLAAFRGDMDAAALLARYNVGQLQVALYDAEELEVTAGRDFKTILRHAKLARLMHEIERVGPSRYCLRLAGAASVLRSTRRYGADLARFLPAVLACDDWSLSARLQTPWDGIATLQLRPEDGYASHLKALPVFDSSVEEKLAARFGESRDGWRLIPEGAILHQGQRAFIPDFVLRHEDGRELMLEIVGFWTPEYMEKKLEVLGTFAHAPVLIAAAEKNAPEAWLTDPPREVLLYKTVVRVKALMGKVVELTG